MEQGRRWPGLLEAIGVWSLFALVALAILVTYSRLPAEVLYHTSGEGLDAGGSRALLFAGFPVALVAIPLAWIAVARIRTSVRRVSPGMAAEQARAQRGHDTHGDASRRHERSEDGPLHALNSTSRHAHRAGRNGRR